MNLQDMDAGLQTVQQVFEQIHIDKQWSRSFDRGFTWWGYRFAQKIWADAPQDDGPSTIIRVHAETDFLKYPASSKPDISGLAKIMPLSTLNGLVHYHKEGRIKWRCSAFVHPENRDWLGMLFSLAAVMQITEAERTGHGLAQMLEFQPDTGCHPVIGSTKRHGWNADV